jgi:hypothetical protein
MGVKYLQSCIEEYSSIGIKINITEEAKKG